jgi:SAM-dependent methyltransferase
MTKQFTHTWEEAVLWLKSQPENIDIVKSCYYDDPINDVAGRFAASEEWAAILRILEDKIPGKVLDLGAGRGLSSYAFAQAGWDVTSLEPNPSDIVGGGVIERLARENSLKIEVVKDYAETLPFEDQTFNLVYGRAVMHHAQNLPKFCREAARVLKPGGILIGTREHVISRKEDLQTFLDSHLLHHLYGGENAYLLSDYLDAIVSSGLVLHKIYAPYDTPINYGPQTTNQLYDSLSQKLSRIFGANTGQWLSNRSLVQQVFRWYGAKLWHAPGRLYSFMAVK